MHVLRGRFVLVAVAFAVAALVVAMVAPTAETQSRPECFGKKVTDGNFGATQGPDNIVGNPQTAVDTSNPNDVINGLGGSDTLIRGEGDFAGTPEGGVDLLCGGEGDDGLIDGADKSDKVRGGPGDDIVDGDNFPSRFGDTLKGDAGADTLTGGQGRDNSDGGSGSDEIDVGTGTVPEGADTLKGGSGNDTINGVDGGARDTITCGRGTDTVTAGQEDRVERRGEQRCENVTRQM